MKLFRLYFEPFFFSIKSTLKAAVGSRSVPGDGCDIHRVLCLRTIVKKKKRKKKVLSIIWLLCLWLMMEGNSWKPLSSGQGGRTFSHFLASVRQKFTPHRCYLCRIPPLEMICYNVLLSCNDVQIKNKNINLLSQGGLTTAHVMHRGEQWT